MAPWPGNHLAVQKESMSDYLAELVWIDRTTIMVDPDCPMRHGYIAFVRYPLNYELRTLVGFFIPATPGGK